MSTISADSIGNKSGITVLEINYGVSDQLLEHIYAIHLYAVAM